MLKTSVLLVFAFLRLSILLASAPSLYFNLKILFQFANKKCLKSNSRSKLNWCCTTQYWHNILLWFEILYIHFLYKILLPFMHLTLHSQRVAHLLTENISLYVYMYIERGNVEMNVYCFNKQQEPGQLWEDNNPYTFI